MPKKFTLDPNDPDAMRVTAWIHPEEKIVTVQGALQARRWLNLEMVRRNKKGEVGLRIIENDAGELAMSR